MSSSVRRGKKGALPTLGTLARDVAARVLDGLGAKISGGEPPRIEPGKLRPIAALGVAEAQRIFRNALVRACGGAGARAADRGVLWRDGDDELLVHAGRASLAVTDRLIVISIPVFTDQTGDADVVIPVATNAEQSALGLIAATEAKPRGPAAIVDAFGDALVAVAWAALVESAAAWAGEAGTAAGHGRLLPAGLAATRQGLVVSAQKKFEPEE